jgi:WD40 repeat protein
VLSGSADTTVILWDAASGQRLLTFEGHTAEVASVAFSPDGQRVLSGSADRTMILWDAASGQRLLTFEGHTAEVASVAFSPDGQRVLSGSADTTVILWHLKTPEELATWARANRYIPVLTCAQRKLYRLKQECEDKDAVFTPV